MDINVPLVKLLPLWGLDFKMRGRPSGKPYVDSTFTTYSRRLRSLLASDEASLKATLEDYFPPNQGWLALRKDRDRTWNFTQTALNQFYGFLLDYDFIKEHPNKGYKPKWKKGHAKKS